MSHPPITALLFLQKTGATWYDAVSNEVAAITFSDDCIRDMEVVNAEQIATLLEPHLAKQSAGPGNAILIIDTPLMFSTNIPTTAESEEAIDDFLELVPFDMVAETQIPGQNQTIVLATNQSLISTFRRILHKHNLTLSFALPLGLYDTSNQQLSPLTASAAQMMIDQAPQLASYSLIPTPPIVKSTPAEQESTETEVSADAQTHKPSYAEDEKKKPHTLKVLIPLFALLVLVLVGMLIWQQQPPSRPTSTLAQASQPTQPTTSTAPAANTNQASTPVNVSAISVQVLAAQDDLARAKEIGATFSQAGFQVLPDTQQTAISTSQTIIFIDATYPKSIRDRVETLLKKHVQTYSVQEADSPANGITIILGSSE